MQSRNTARHAIGLCFAAALFASLLVFVAARSVRADKARPTVHLTIVVTGGEENKPVDSASVYVRFDKVEMNLKTNLSGVCHAPEIPSGRVLIQVVSPGWKPFGEYYDANQAEQTINITLARPPKWY